MINTRFSADWVNTKPIAAFSCTHSVQEVHTKAEVVPLSLAFSCTLGVQENAVISLFVTQSAEIVGLIICFAIHFLCVTIE